MVSLAGKNRQSPGTVTFFVDTSRRTGAGKSSVMTALYRLVELSSGSIQIDGVDTSKVGLEQLRKGLAIIPQDAVSLAS